MAWYDNAVFYHIYPLGMTGAPKENAYGEPVERLNRLLPWISHIKNIGCNALYIGPLFESVGLLRLRILKKSARVHSTEIGTVM